MSDCLSDGRVLVDWYEKQGPDRFVFHTGEAVTFIDTKGHTVTTNKGRTIAYDYCVLATGSDATLPSYVDRAVEGVFVYRNIADLNNLLSYSERTDVQGTPVRFTNTHQITHSSI